MKQNGFVAQRNPRILLLSLVTLLCGLALVMFAFYITSGPGFHRKIGAVMFSGAVLAAVSFSQVLTALCRCPRLELTPNCVTIRGLATTQSAAWTSLGAFHVEPRPFGMDFQNDVISAKVTGPDIHRAFKRAGKIAIDARYYEPSSQTLCAELNAARNLALTNSLS